MNKRQFQDLDALRDHCDAVEILGYNKTIPVDELDRIKDQLYEDNLSLLKIREEKAEANRDFNEQIKKLEQSISEAVMRIRNKSDYVEEECYKFVDFDTQTVVYYNDEQKPVYSREARADELQRNIFNVAQ